MPRLWSRLSLTWRYLILGSLVGVTVWLILDHYQSNQLNKLLEREIKTQLDSQSKLVGQRFYEVVGHQEKLLRLLAETESIAHALEDYQHGKPIPNWHPDATSWRGLAAPSHMLLYSPDAELLDNWQINQRVDIPETLSTRAGQYLHSKNVQSMLTLIDDHPSLFVASPVYYHQNLIGYFGIYTHIDSLFLRISLADVLPRQAAAVLLSGDYGNRTIMASTNPGKLTPGLSEKVIAENYYVAGKSFFDQGDWGLNNELAVAIPTSHLSNLSAEVTTLAFQDRVIMTVMLASVFTLMMILSSRRLSRLGERINDYMRREFSSELPSITSADPIKQLEHGFDTLTDVVGNYHQQLSMAHELALVQSKINILQSATNELRIGVLQQIDEQWQPLNPVMQSMIDDVGDIKYFTTHIGPEQSINDRSGKRRIFDIAPLDHDDQHLLMVSETTELALKTEKLAYLAMYDPLTGLANRALFQDRLKQELVRVFREESSLAILMMDIDNFKEINDTLGHQTGDEILKEIAYRLQQFLRSNDTFSRMGGDEFTILLPGADENRACMVATRLGDSLRVPFYSQEGIEVGMNLSIGIVLAPQHASHATSLMSYADIAMYHAKKNHMNYVVYNDDINVNNTELLQLRTDLRRAIELDQLVLHYQPKLNLQAMMITGWEALIRWQHPKHGLIAPNVFIPLAEDSGYIRDISRWVIDQAIADCCAWQQAGQFGGVAVNLSSRDFEDELLLSRVSKALNEHQLEANQITLEVTESILMENPTLAQSLINDLHSIGIRLSIDDFGTGYSSLSYLKLLPVDEIKVDRSFIANLEDDSNDAAIVRSIINLGATLNHDIVAEGIENIITLKRLHFMQCDNIQGYLLSKPIPLAEVINFELGESFYEHSELLVRPAGNIEK